MIVYSSIKVISPTNNIELKNTDNLNKEEPIKEEDKEIKNKDKIDDKINLNKNNNATKIINNQDNKDNNIKIINININTNKNNIIDNKKEKEKEKEKEIPINTNKNINNNNNNKNNNNTNNIIIKDQKENKKEIKPYINESSTSKYKNTHARNNKGTFIKEDSGKLEFSSATKLHSRMIKLNSNKSQESLLIQSERLSNKNKISEDNKAIIMNYNPKSKNNDKVISPKTKKLYKTFSNFPKINHENNNMSIPLSNDIFTKTISEEKFFRRKSKPNSYINYRKKILLMKPEDIPANYFEKTFQEMFKKNLHLSFNKNGKINFNKNKDINGVKMFLKK